MNKKQAWSVFIGSYTDCDFRQDKDFLKLEWDKFMSCLNGRLLISEKQFARWKNPFDNKIKWIVGENNNEHPR